MKLILLFSATVLASVAVHSESPINTPRASDDLRMVLQQKPPSGQSAYRQLSPEERAELRRQLMQFGKAGGKSS